MLYALLVLITAVERHKFRTCEQGSFCRRYLKWYKQQKTHPQTHWELITPNPDLKSNEFLLLKNINEDVSTLFITFQFYKSGPARILIDETNSNIKQRYRIPFGDVLVNEELIDPIISKNEETQRLEYRWKAVNLYGSAYCLLSIQPSPFKIDLYVNDVLTQTINGHTAFNFEIYRRQTRKDKVIDAANEPGVDEHGLWDEMFHEHHDYKPFGPAALGVDALFHRSKKVYGLPSHAASLGLNGKHEPYRLYNLDVFQYELEETMALYGSVPMLWAPGDVTTAFYWNNPSETFVNVQDTTDGKSDTWWLSESGVMDMIMFPGPNALAISHQFHELTGKAFMPPLFSLGKHQCRWNYESVDDVQSVDDKFDQHDIPYDTIWLDIEHTDGKRYFTWDQRKFGQYASMLEYLAKKNRNLVTIVDPHIKMDGGYSFYQKVNQEAHLWVQDKHWRKIDALDVQRPENADEHWHPPQMYDPHASLKQYDGWCWPGSSKYPDFSKEEMKEVWAKEFEEYLKPKGESSVFRILSSGTVDYNNWYTWNDMNEPSVFDGPEVSMNRHLLHGEGQIEHRDLHNLYGKYVHEATYRGHMYHNSTKRTFILTRSFFTGTHRTAAVWTGDNVAEWDHLQISVPMLLAHALGGQSNIGADVGGFFRNVGGELMVRWYQLAAVAYPFFRNHAHLETRRREPWTFTHAPWNVDNIRNAVRRRYHLILLWYTLFYEYVQTGIMVIRPMWYQFPGDQRAMDNKVENNQMVVGHHLIVAPVTHEHQQQISIYLPTPAYCYETDHRLPKGMYKMNTKEQYIPTYVIAGTIIPMRERIRRSSMTMVGDPLTLNVYLDDDENAKGTLFTDDYVTFEYQEGNYVYTQFEWNDMEFKSTVEGNGDFEFLGHNYEIERIVVYGLKFVPGTISNTAIAGKSYISFDTQPLTPILSDIRHVNDGGHEDGKSLHYTNDQYKIIIIRPQLDVRKKFHLVFTNVNEDL